MPKISRATLEWAHANLAKLCQHRTLGPDLAIRMYEQGLWHNIEVRDYLQGRIVGRATDEKVDAYVLALQLIREREREGSGPPVTIQDLFRAGCRHNRELLSWGIFKQIYQDPEHCDSILEELGLRPPRNKSYLQILEAVRQIEAAQKNEIPLEPEVTT